MILGNPEASQAFFTGASGWSAAGLLAAVLGWLLLKHLPAKDAQIERLIVLFTGKLEEIRVENRATLTLILAHAEEQLKLLVESMRREFDELKRSVDCLCDPRQKRETNP